MLKCYTYFNDLLSLMCRGKTLPVKEIRISGGRKSGKSFAVQEFCVKATNLVGSNAEVVPVGVYALRNFAYDTKELFSEMIQTLDRYNANYSTKVVEGMIKLQNDNFISVTGIRNRNKEVNKAGLARAERMRYLIVYVEEAYEVDKKDIQAMKEAVRANAGVEILFIYVANPWSLLSAFVSECVAYMKHNIYQLQTHGEQIGLFDEIKELNVNLEGYFDKGIKKKVLVHYTNWRVAAKEKKISQDDIELIFEARKISANRFRTADLGLPGYTETSIYAAQMEGIANPIYKRHAFYYGGCDVGLGTNHNAGVTTFVFVGITPGKDLDVYGEYSWDNRKYQKAPDQIAREGVQFFINMKDKIFNECGFTIRRLEVRVDYSDKAFISILNQEARNAFVSHWLTFIKCSKKPIIERVTVTQYMLANKTMRINENCLGLRKELSTAEWDNKKGKKENSTRKDDNDHFINAFEYAIEVYQNQMIPYKVRDFIV